FTGGLGLLALAAALLLRRGGGAAGALAGAAGAAALLGLAVHLGIEAMRRRRAVSTELIRDRREAERAGRAKAQFLTTMSHEMRTPLNGIIGTASLLLETPLAEDQRALATALKDSAELLLQLVTDVLDFSKIEAAAVTLERVVFDPAAAAEAVIALLRPRAERKRLTLGLAVAADVPRRLVGDPDRFRQVLFNLVSNGIKFTETGGVSVDVGHAGRDGDRAVVTVAVRDTGIGIAAEQLPQLFQEFVQLDGSISRRFRGTGLGLAICDRLTRLMGGAIGVESMPGRGSTFRFTIAAPCAPEGSPLPATTAAPAPAGQGRRFLLVEDDETNRLIGLRVLAKLGYAVDTAVNGREAVEAVRAGAYDLVLMDVMMPEMDGIQATRLIRGLPPPRGSVPILALTANYEYAARCAEAGMDGFVAKPFTPASLKESVAALLAGSAAPRPAPADTCLFAAERVRLLMSEIGGSAARDLVEIFLADAQKRLGQMRALAGSGETKALGRSAHSIKSSAATFGLSRLAAVAAEIESEAATASSARVSALLDEAAEALGGGRSAWLEAAL
ncbi:MAG TPA: ATP-binding protein, partial [Stellaceae bacterium]|nr:ATP-binding protein [Stellaceae bacterium]